MLEALDPRDPTPTVDLVAKLHPTLNLGGFFHHAVTALPDNPALLDLSSGTLETVSFGALETRIQRAVAALKAGGIERAAKIAVALPNSAVYLEIFFALMRIGAIPVPLNFKLTQESLDYILKDSGARAIVGDPGDAARACDSADRLALPLRICVHNERAGWTPYSRFIEGARPDTAIATMNFDDQAFQAYTAGSTGRPKGIYLTHGGMLWGIEHSQRYWPTKPDERRIVAAPMYHKNAMRGQIKPAFRGGSSIVVMKGFEARAFLKAVSDYGVTTSGGVPAMYAELLRHEDVIAKCDFSKLRAVSMGSSTVPLGLIERLKRAFPNALVKEGYGLTEGGAPLRQPLDKRKPPHGSVGMLAPETEVKLIDKDGKENPREGEMWMRTPYVLKEYVNQPELTKEKIRDGWLRTGDLFRVDDDGFFYFVSRIDDMFVCGGENLYPKEVETLILKHPDVADVVVVPLPHASKGQAPAAAVVCHSGKTLTPPQIQDFCAANGPAFAIPRAVMLLPQIPVSGAGKPDRAEVKRQLAAAFGTLSSRNEAAAR